MINYQNHSIRRPYDRESNILIVDDDSTLLKFFKIHLNKFFSRVVVVENGKAALDSMKERDMDLVLTDVRMPKIDGLELLSKIRKNHPEIPVLLISGEPMSDDQKTLVKNADGFLTKPFTIDELNDYICAGIDLRFAMKDLIGNLKDPKKIRTAMTTDQKSLEKLIKADSLQATKEIMGRINKHYQKVG